jgi:hypothetical protein
MNDEKMLAPIEQKTVEFYGDQIVAVRLKDGAIYVPIRPICDLLGLDWSAQRQRLTRDPVLSQKTQGVGVITTPSKSGVGGGLQEMLALPLDYVSGFLFGVNAGRVKEEVREKLILYQEKCYRVLSDAFFEGRLSPDTDFEALLRSDSAAAQAYKTFQALAKLARHQLILESRIDQHEARLEQLEATMGDPDRYVTPDQASQISQAVKTVALKLGQASGRNEYGSVYGELYRKFGITGYKQLPSARFQEAMNWLNEWRESNEGELPF